MFNKKPKDEEKQIICCPKCDKHIDVSKIKILVAGDKDSSYEVPIVSCPECKGVLKVGIPKWIAF